ncbi:MAG: GNAT family N-acetyltransferase [Candidatus Sericytochromatia bacterium]|nr:GNAT family N-acetyltransferase [Candidatus Tanganyikabacteria bacterium]
MIATVELTPERWPDLEKLFGAKGACGGCWCQSWRVGKGERWDAIKGDEARRRMEYMVKSGIAHGILAYESTEPIGWCAFDRRRDFLKLDRAPSLACDDADAVWSLPCFFVRRDRQGRGVASALLAHALEALRAHGASIAEGYPAKPAKDGKPLPAAFAWTGTRSLFERAGFELVGNPDGGKQRMRKFL